MDIANRYNLYVVEDAAQGVNAKYKDRYLGTIGDIGTYSFFYYVCNDMILMGIPAAIGGVLSIIGHISKTDILPNPK